MTRAELEQYARDNRKRLEAQDVRLGDVVKILGGHFAGEKGVVVGIIALDYTDFSDPYYELRLECDVPKEYCCRKHLLPLPQHLKTVGGFNKCDFEVRGSYKPTEL